MGAISVFSVSSSISLMPWLIRVPPGSARGGVTKESTVRNRLSAPNSSLRIELGRGPVMLCTVIVDSSSTLSRVQPPPVELANVGGAVEPVRQGEAGAHGLSAAAPGPGAAPGLTAETRRK